MLDALPYAGEMTEKQTAFVARCRNRVSEALDMIRDLLDYAAADGALEKRPVRVRLMPELQGVFETVQSRAEAEGIQPTGILVTRIRRNGMPAPASRLGRAFLCADIVLDLRQNSPFLWGCLDCPNLP